MEEAVRSGNLARVQELIQDGADVNACSKGTPLLSLAIKTGHNKVALELIDHGANVHTKDAFPGWTALHWACKHSYQEELIPRLIELGSSVNEEDSAHVTPLSLTAARSGLRSANYLLRSGASCKTLSRKQMNMLFLPACRLGDAFVAKTLAANGCDINARNQSGEPAIMLAVDGGHEEVVKILILAGAKLDLQDLEGSTALHYAALNEHIQCGILLTEGGANVGIKDKHSRTALHVARSKEFKEAIKQAMSFTISKIVCIVGNTGVGKSTLVAALKAERNSFLGKAFNRFWRVSDHRKRTAGVETIHHSSQRYGETLFYDFAGQHKYYGPHQAFLESFLSNPGVSMTLLLVVVKATDREEAILDQLYYWLFPIAQMATSASSSPQIIIIGSFLDQVESKDEAAVKLSQCIKETRKHLNNILQVKCVYPCLLNCRQPQSEGIDQLCRFLHEAPIPKLKAIHTQYSLAWVLSQISLAFKDKLAVQLHTLTKWMQENRENLPQTIPSAEEVCKDLSAAGHALYLPNKDHCHESWLVLDLAGFLHDFYGTLSSQPKESMNRFGLLHRKELARLLPKMCLETLQQLLVTLKFCIPVDPMVLCEDVSKLTASKEDNGWFFFPAFVSAEPPKVASVGHTQQVCSLWWRLETSGKHFFFARVPHTILLCLTAHFVTRHDRGDGVQQHCCSVWRNGISWQSKEGINVTVHITNRAINLVSVSEETDNRLRQYLTEVIVDIISTVRQICPHLKAVAYIVHRPMRMTVTCEEFAAPSRRELFPVTDMKRSIESCNNHLLPIAGGDSCSSKVLISDLFGGHTPSLEDIVRLLWVQHDPIRPQLLAESDAQIPVIPSHIIPTQLQVYHLNHPTFVFVSNPVLSWSLKFIYHH